MLSNRKGFTLIELLIVVVIIGILAAIAIPKFAATKDKAKLSSVKTDVRNIMSLMEGYASDSGKYVSPDQAKIPLSSGNKITAATANANGNGYTYPCYARLEVIGCADLATGPIGTPLTTRRRLKRGDATGRRILGRTDHWARDDPPGSPRR